MAILYVRRRMFNRGRRGGILEDVLMYMWDAIFSRLRWQ